MYHFMFGLRGGSLVVGNALRAGRLLATCSCFVFFFVLHDQVKLQPALRLSGSQNSCTRTKHLFE